MESKRNRIAAIAVFLELPADFVLTSATQITAIPGWDSFAWVNVVTALEEMSGREFPIDNIENIKTLGDLIDAVLD